MKKKSLKNIKIVFFKKNIKDNCKNVDLIILHTEWDEFKIINFKKLSKNKKIKIYDLRNIYNIEEMKLKNINYFSVGRPDII